MAVARGTKPSQGVRDDLVLPFETVRSNVVGRVVRLGESVDEILTRHDYPAPVNETLGQAIALTAMLGAALKPGGRLNLQTKTDGPLGFLVVDFEAGGRTRGYASFDAERIRGLEQDEGKAAQGKLLGSGHLAMTIDPGPGADRTQGIVALDGGSLTSAAHTYFRQSEQLPTYVRLAVARQYVGAGGGQAGRWHWRAGGLLVQHPKARETEEDWQRARILAATVEDHELLDPTLEPERLLLRLFHEEGVKAFPAMAVFMHCRCSRERVQMFLTQFGSEQLADLREPDGGLSVTCEFCSTVYRFPPEEVA